MRSILYHASLWTAGLLLVSCKTQLHPTVNKEQFYSIDSTIVADSGIVAYYGPYKAKLDAEMNRVIGVSDQYLTHSRAQESLMGDFFTDALLWKAQQIDPEVQLSFATKGGIRAELKQGNITVGDVFQVMPFENALSILTLSGKDILRLADYMAKTGGQPAAGIKLVAKDGQVVEFLVQGKTVDPAASYKLATYDYLANGGDYITFFDQLLARKDYPQRIRETLMEYIAEQTKQGKHIQAQIDGRVQISK